MDGEFSVCRFWIGGYYEYVRRYVQPEEAVRVFRQYIDSPEARLGTVTRIIVTDGGDCINAEWVFGKGLTYPPQS